MKKHLLAEASKIPQEDVGVCLSSGMDSLSVLVTLMESDTEYNNGSKTQIGIFNNIIKLCTNSHTIGL